MPKYCFGKHPAKHDYRTLRFKNYVTPGLAAPPPSFSVLTEVYKNLDTTDAPTLFPMDGNDTLGDCTIAGLAHATTAYDGLLGKREVMPADSVEALYKKLTGGPDTGLNELDVLKYWSNHKIYGSDILAFVSIDPKNHTHIQQAIQLFGGVYLGFQVQQNAIPDFDARKPWTPGKLTTDGHCVYAVAYDQNGVTVLTWGNTQQGTWDWWDECVDEAFGIVPQQAQKPGFAPGFNVTQLIADLKQVQGQTAIASTATA
ncbi:MAG TPA: hypothetical protein VMF66_09740 [Candidatus Acidoferrum sp.]|nr:hypothetical protein [Candidatus Acidoferrum sp.]